MISDQPIDVLALLKSGISEPRKPIPLARLDFSAFYEEMQEGEGEAAVVKSVEISKGLQGYWIDVSETVTNRIILFFHGGGFTLGSTKDHLGLCARIGRAAQAQVFSLDYRLAPEHTFPAPVDDAIAAYQFLLSSGHSSHQIIPVGISTGGTLVIDLLLSARDRRLPLPTAGVCMSPLVDMLFNGESMIKNLDNDWVTPTYFNAIRTAYLGGQEPRHPLASPVFARLSGLPRLYIQAGTHELLLSDVAAFVDKARWSGVPVQFELWEGMFHCWQVFARHLPEGQRAISHIGAFVKDALDR